ncbi:DUF3761 domain-containing protein [Sodalis sp. dw_96]|uniref:DUF3761 domain-containing protein n=1 Tax=Sodalis sp. dw_96 TaxID=2719794 RepID=UPI001BD4F1A2|nr:DUF3761 domain-containing protein [Sodalis sp. dw_96]
MRLFIAVFFCLLVFQPAWSKQPSSNSPVISSRQNNDLIEQGEYINSAGQQIHQPAHSKSGKVPSGASAKCRDGAFSFSTHRRGTCSGHRGVAQWLN